jgi:preprotein translocase subunit SecE
MAVTARRRNQRDQEFAPVRFLRETFEELRKVVWPTPAELYRYTLVVLITVVVIAAFIGAVDLALSEISKRWIYAAVKGA